MQCHKECAQLVWAEQSLSASTRRDVCIVPQGPIMSKWILTVGVPLILEGVELHRVVCTCEGQ